MIGKLLLDIGKNLNNARHQQTSVICFKKTAAGLMVAEVQLQENVAIFTLTDTCKKIPALNLHKIVT